MNFLLTLFVSLFVNAADTLGTYYGGSWQGVEDPEHSNVIMQTMASQGLIFVVLGVSLVIWFVLIFYLIRLEKKLSDLEKKLPE